MKVKVLSRNPDDYRRSSKLDLQKVPRNYDPALHPFEGQREYVRALNAVKLNRVFAKPFIAGLEGHLDGVSQIAKSQTVLNSIFSGSYDGEVRAWNLTTHKCLWNVQAHQGWVRSLACARDGQKIISVGDDKTVKIWSTTQDQHQQVTPLNSIVTKSLYTGVDCNWHDDTFITCGQTVDLWTPEKAEPIKSFKWGHSSVGSCKFNPTEKNYVLSTTADRGIILYDVRASKAVNKVVLKMKSNVAVWNPQEAMMFTAANEDHNLYTFDIRNWSCASHVHTDHVAAVLDVDYSPTGKEFVSGGYDKTIRIFRSQANTSREVYHTKRMQRVTSVKFTMDAKYVLSGSDETNIRIWKANASEQLGRLAPRQRANQQYGEKLMEKFKSHPQVRRIAKHRHVPKSVYHASKEKREMKEAARRKEQNRRVNSKPGTVPVVPERKKHIVGQAIPQSDSEESD